MNQVKSIKCTNCAAPLTLLGGGRVESITCSYCKSVLDLNDNYKVLTNFKNIREKNKLPFAIGMKGKLKSIDYTIIGRVTYSTIGYSDEEWTDFLLFSNLYGYAYLTYENGHLIYSKRSRTFPNLTWMQTKQNGSVMLDNKTYVPFDEYEARITYVEGELTWVAKRNDKTFFIDLIAAPYGLSVEKSKGEIEHYQAEYLDSQEVYKAFSLKIEAEPESFHALKPFERPFLKSLSHIAYWVLFIIALLTLTTNMDGSGKAVQSLSANNTQVKNIDFFVNSSKYLVDFELQASTAKELKNFNLQIHQNKKILFTLNSSATYIFNTQSAKIQKKLHTWEKGAKKVRVSLNLEEGIYHLSIKPIDMTLKSTLLVKIKEESSRLNYLGWFFSFTFILWLIYKFFSWRYKRKVDNERGIYHDNSTNTWDDVWGSNVINKIYWVFLIIGLFIFLDVIN